VPAASTMNYANVPGLNIAHGIAVPICTAAPMSCPFDLSVQANGAAGTHLVIDVFGYFR
jgi:hypothetical protein